MIRDHRFYEMQSALAATGHLTNSEVTELEQHVEQCASCRKYIMEMADISRELILVQNQSLDIGYPSGMQQRFVQRALSAGIPLKARAAWRTAVDQRFASFAAVGVVLMLLIFFSWKVVSIPHVERAMSQPPQADTTTKPVQTAIRRLPAITVRQAALTSNKHLKPRNISRAMTPLKRPRAAQSEADSHLYLALNGSLFANAETSTSFSDGSTFWSQRLIQTYLMAGAHAAGSSSFTRPYAAHLLGHGWNSKAEERSFHFDLTMASLSHSDSPLNSEISAPPPKLRFSTPVFHLDPNRAW